MAKEKTLEQIEAQMNKLREKKDALHAERQALAAERRKLILAQQPTVGGLVLTPEPAIIEAKTEQ
jgi:hypothetical protein